MNYTAQTRRVVGLLVVVQISIFVVFAGVISADVRTTAMINVVRSDPATAEGFVPKDGFVPTGEVAIAIAVAIWEPIYGKDKIAKERPFRARLNDQVWTVEGSLPEGSKGGVAEAKISKADARILYVSHGK
jgi:hypothetical protein